MSKIVVLHETFLRERHLADLRKVAEVQIYRATKDLSQARGRLLGANIAVVDSFVLPLDEDFFRCCSHLELVVISSTGYDKVDLQAAERYKVRVANTPDFSTDSVAELNLALIFSLSRKLLVLDKKFRENPQKPDCDPFDPEMLPFFGDEIAGKTLGTIGFGNIGKALAQKANALGLRVLAYSKSSKESDFVQFVDLEKLLRESDFVTINVPLTGETAGMIGEKELRQMKNSAYLVNTARAGVLETKALEIALQRGEIAGAGLEVVEALPQGHPLLQMENVIFGWHSGSLTKESSWEKLPRTIVRTVLAFLGGNSQNLIN